MRTTLLFALVIPALLPAQDVELNLVASGLSGPLDIDNAGDARLFITERPGLVRIIMPNGDLATQPFLDITDRVQTGSGEQGLLGLTFDPAYAANGYFYVNYIHGAGSGSTRISRFSVSADPNVADPQSEVVLWTTTQPGTNHNGGDLWFGPDGYLWFALGDGGGAGDPDNLAQNLMSPHGKMLRIDVHGGSPYAIPSDNPYVGQTGTALPEIWASGLRNPFRFSFDVPSNALWIADVGQGAYEELNLWSANDHSGANFGWRCYEGPAPYNTSGCGDASSYDAPVFSHSHADGSCSIIGGHVYRGSAIPEWIGNYIYSDFCHGRIHMLTSDGNGGWQTQALTEETGMGISSFGMDSNGELLVANTIEGTVSRIVATSTAPSVALQARVYLEGPFDETAGLMKDDLRLAGLIPGAEPYTQLGNDQMAGGGDESLDPALLDVTGSDAIVDWVRVELRAASDPAITVATQQALLQRDGDVVAADGDGSLIFNAAPGPYHVVLRHRNHLGVMTATPRTLGGVPEMIDATSAAFTAHGTDARKDVSGVMMLWAGDADHDGVLKYTGGENDRDRILQLIGGSTPTNMIMGYDAADVDMDGVIRYTGEQNDRDRILVNIGGVIPTNTRGQQVP